MIRTSSFIHAALSSRNRLVWTLQRLHNTNNFYYKNYTIAAANMSTEVIATAPPPVSVRTRRRAREQKQETTPGMPPPPAAAAGGMFPLGYKDAVYQWWTSVTPTVAERNVIAHIPYLREAVAQSTSPLAEVPSADHPGSTETAANIDPYGPRLWKSEIVKLSGKNRGLNEFSIERVGEPVDDTLVMLHGYGAGLGFFYKNFESLTRTKGWKLYALDMLGMGNSMRPSFKIHAKDPQDKITEAESFFVDALEEWRKVRKLEKFTLLGHSLGGYLAVSYALKYPGRLNKLILASPVGIPEDPYAVSAEMPEPQESTFQDEFTQDQQETTQSHGNVKSLSAKGKAGADVNAPKKRPYPNWLIWLWDANVSPFSIVRMAGPFGPRFVSGWTSRRFNHLPEEEAQTLHDYSYSLFRQRGSGEYALPYLLAPGAFARRPVINRIQDVGRSVIQPATASSPEVKENGFPIVFMYGENDWMDVAGGLAAEEKLKQVKAQVLRDATEEQKKRENGSAKVIIIPKAGHHLYLDNADNFNEVMREELEDTRRQTLKEKAERS